MAMFSDDELMDRLVLKGGNLLDLVYTVSARSSLDVDLSVDGDLGDVPDLEMRIERALKGAFGDIGYETFDVHVEETPENLSSDMADIWGGYAIDFKIIERHKHQEFARDIEQLRRNATSIGKQGSTKFQIDISKHEFCEPKQARELENLTIYCYTPPMVACEKLRAICQQMPEYSERVKRTRPSSARARDFVDIHVVSERCGMDLAGRDVKEMLPKVFAAKRVPLELLGRIAEYRDYHSPDFAQVQATVKPGFNLRDFDFYFDFVVEATVRLESLWNE